MAKDVFYTLNSAAREADPRIKSLMAKDYFEQSQFDQKKAQEKKREENETFDAAVFGSALQEFRNIAVFVESLQKRDEARADALHEEQKHRETERVQQLMAESQNTPNADMAALEEAHGKVEEQIGRIDDLIDQVNADYTSKADSLRDQMAAWNETSWQNAVKSNANVLAENLPKPKEEEAKCIAACMAANPDRTEADIQAAINKKFSQTMQEIAEIMGQGQSSPFEAMTAIPEKQQQFNEKYSEYRKSGMEQEDAYAKAVIDTVKSEYGLSGQITVAAKMFDYFKFLDKLSGGNLLKDGVTAVKLAVKYAQDPKMREATDKYFAALIKSSAKSPDGKPSPHVQLAELDRLKNDVTNGLANLKNSAKNLTTQDLRQPTKLEQITKMVDKISQSMLPTVDVQAKVGYRKQS